MQSRSKELDCTSLLNPVPGVWTLFKHTLTCVIYIYYLLEICESHVRTSQSTEYYTASIMNKGKEANSIGSYGARANAPP